MLDGELLIGYVWWEGEEGWSEVLDTNDWPPDTAIVTSWKVRNTGDESAFLKVSFMGLESVAVSLSPGDEATLFLYPVTPSAGTYAYVLAVIADGEVVAEYPVQLVTGEGLSGILPLVLVGGLGVLGVGALVALSARSRE